MILIEWRSDFSTGIASVDHEHQTLIAMINDLFAVLEATPPGGCTGDGDCGSGILSEIHDAISAHFALEEKLMRERRYPDFRIHKADHERLLEDIRDLMDRYERGDFSRHRDALAGRMTIWFSTHFRLMDARFHAEMQK